MYEIVNLSIEFIPDWPTEEIYILCYIDRPIICADVTEVPRFE